MKHSITVQNKKHSYTLRPSSKNSTFFECRDANISQEFLNKDIPALLNDLPNLIIAEKEYKKNQDDIIRFRVSPEDKKIIEKKAVKNGYSSVSGFLRHLALEA